MRTALLLAFALAFALPLSGCDSTGLDDGDVCSTCGDEPASTSVPVSPRQTYTRTSGDSPIDAPALRLSDLGYAAGDPICFRAEGDFTLAGTATASGNDQPLLSAVFSSSDTLLDRDQRFRVPGAIDAGVDVETRVTDEDNVVTDIDEDFQADDVCLTVPAGAEFVFVAAFDNFYADNLDLPGAPLGVRIDDE